MVPTLTLLRRLAKRFHPHLRGALAEKVALAYYSCHGYRLLKARHTPQIAQTDLTLSRGGTMLMVEVKYRVSQERGHLALTPVQQERLNRQMIALSGRHSSYACRLEVFLVFPHWPFTQRIRHLD